MAEREAGTVLILGAVSAIARGTADAFARRGYSLYLAGRDLEELERLAADMQLRHGVDVDFGQFDALDPDGHAAFVQGVVKEVGELAGVVWAVGYMPAQDQALADFSQVRRIADTNFTAAMSVLDVCAAHFTSKGGGFIVAISSVAGDRGRQSNYYYGAAKGALTLYLQGLRNRLHPTGVRVLTVKPGFVDTAMTWGLPGLFLVASPEQVGRAIATAVERGRDVLYVPWFWRYIMLIIRHIPERIFKRLKL
jgi:decaprenylphospho-beta-D-erythro-pentofuranosid-2-ulose 2-reductase